MPMSRIFSNFYSNKNCMVTGHTGFKGSWLCTWLNSLGAKVTGYALEAPTKPSLFGVANISSFVEDIRGDIRSYEQIASAVRKTEPEIVFHLAAQSLVRESYKEPRQTFETNVCGTVNILEAVRNCPSVKSVVIITTDKCYENKEWVYSYREVDPLGGHDPYSASKAAAEIVTSAYERSFLSPAGVGTATARAGNVIGGGDWASDRIIPDAVKSIEGSSVLEIRNPASIRPWQHVLEPLSGYLLLGAMLAENPKKYNGPWNFGPHIDCCRQVGELIKLFFDSYGKGSWKDGSDGQSNAPHEASHLALACDKAHSLLRWHPVWNFEEAIYRTSTWYRKYTEGKPPYELCINDIEEYIKHGK